MIHPGVTGNNFVKYPDPTWKELWSDTGFGYVCTVALTLDI